MHWTLLNGTTQFAIANGDDRLSRVPESADGVLSQETQVVGFTRAAWATAFPDRAQRSIELAIPVTFPPCASLDAAHLESLTIPATCPNGGLLIGHNEGEGIEFAQAWVASISFRRIGLTNTFVFNLRAVNPSAVSYYVDAAGGIYTDSTGAPYSG